MRRFVSLLLLLAGCITLTARAADDDLWTRANQAYAAGNFRAAADDYEKMAASGATSAALFYNLGNAHYRLNDFGQAILQYERALALDPHQPEAEANLRLVRDKARALELQRDWLAQLLARGTATRYSLGAAAGFWLVAFSLAALYFARRKSSLLIGLATLGVIGLGLCGYALYALETGANGRALAIVTAKKTDARLATADSAGTVLTLPPGSEVRILSTRGDWSYAVLPNNLRGWIPAQSAERVRP